LSHVYCPECGFQNPAAANFCSKCGAKLLADAPGEQTESFTAEELDEDAGATLEQRGLRGPALVVRSGGGRAGETFFPDGETSLIGRSPECDIFLDDVTVSRKHAVLLEENGRWAIEDGGSLNGTFVNRRRVDRAELEDGDEVQIGKYRLVYFASQAQPAAASEPGGAQ
jgi:FHA domain-containing protein/zinc ribbon protein